MGPSLHAIERIRAGTTFVQTASVERILFGQTIGWRRFRKSERMESASIPGTNGADRSFLGYCRLISVIAGRSVIAG
jgi:hypothetical protein